MRLTEKQLAQYERDGYLVIPEVVPPDELARLRSGLESILALQDPRVLREKDGSAPRTIYGLHDLEGPTGLPAFADLACSPELTGPVGQLLGDDDLYMVHSKLNLKEALVGEIWSWHQDYGVWQHDGIERPELATVLLMLDEATEVGGCLYFIPGSHHAGNLDTERDASVTKLRAVPHAQMVKIVERYGEPVAVRGQPGTIVIFHPNLVHGSGHNMSTHARRQLYLVYNTLANAPRPVENPRHEWQSSRRIRPLRRPALAG